MVAKSDYWTKQLLNYRTKQLLDYWTTGLSNHNGIRRAAVHAELAALATMNVDKGRLVIIDAHKGFGLADGLRRAAAADATAVVIDP